MRIEGSSSTSSTTTSSGVSQPATDLRKDFMHLLITQLQHQDPLQPMQDRELVAQLAQLSSLESLQSIERLAAQQQSLGQLSQAAALIGRTVAATSGDAEVTGKVTAATVGSDEQIYLTIGSQSVALADVRRITD